MFKHDNLDGDNYTTDSDKITDTEDENCITDSDNKFDLHVQQPQNSLGLGNTNRKKSLTVEAIGEDKPVNNQITVTGIISPSGEYSFDNDNCMVVRLSLDELYWAVGLSSGAIKMFSTVNEKLKNPVFSLMPEEAIGTCTDITFVPFEAHFKPEKKHLLLAVYATGQIRIWHYTGATSASRLLATLVEVKELDTMDQDYHTAAKARPSRSVGSVAKPKIAYNQILACSCSADSARFITGGEDGTIRVYDLATRKRINTCFSASSQTSDMMHSHMMRVCALVYHPWGDRSKAHAHIFVSGGWDDSVHIWDDRHSCSLWQYFGPHICGSDSLDIDPDHNQIVTTSWRRDKSILQVWKFNEHAVELVNDSSTPPPAKPPSEKPFNELKQDVAGNMISMGYVAQWIGSSYIAFGGSGQNIIKIVDRLSLSTLGAVVDLPNGVYSIAAQVPTSDDHRKPIRLAVCCGTKLYYFRVEKK